MKKIAFLSVLAVIMCQLNSCEIAPEGVIEGSTVVSFDTKALLGQATDIGFDESDVNSFLFEVTDSKGVVYSGPFNMRPQPLTVTAGECSFCIVTREYSGPEYDNPIYGDNVVKDVGAGENFEVSLSCHQVTSGVQILFSDEFRDAFPEGFVRIIRRDTVTNAVEYVDYHMDETGFYHFLPGLITVNLMKDSDSSPELLTGKVCEETDMFSVNVKIAPSDAYGSVNVMVDTVLYRYCETYDYGRKRTGKSVFNAVEMSDLASFAGDTVWVAGYITGSYVNKKWHPGVDAETVTSNVSLSSCPNAETACPAGISSGKCKVLNLKEHPEYLGERVAIYGIVGKLYDIDGIKKAIDYMLL